LWPASTLQKEPQNLNLSNVASLIVPRKPGERVHESEMLLALVNSIISGFCHQITQYRLIIAKKNVKWWFFEILTRNVVVFCN
jgi:hypothetical protein